MNIHIAGVSFAINSPTSLNLKNPNPYYENFTRSGRYDGSPDINVTIEFGHMPNTENLPRIFDGDAAWSTWQTNDHYIVTLHSPASDRRLLCAAQFDSSVRNATVYAGTPFTRTSADRDEYFNPFSYPLDQILLMYFLAQREGALIHAAGINIGGRGYLFPGKSGAGKTTLSRLFSRSENYEVLNDDRIVVRKVGGVFRMFGTPWPGDAGIAQNKDFPLYGIFFIRHGIENSIRQLRPAEAVKKCIPVTSIPWYDKAIVLDILAFFEALVLDIPSYEFSFRPDEDVVKSFEHFLSK
ncbi:MAG TPA: hypothetical protein VEI28_05740 [Thermodesulfovibrionales bacterium]|nr:hypothetical protein [Thermodesulfovibrionales bacterium]